MGASPPAQRDEFLPIFASVESAWFRIAASSGEPGAEPDGSAAAAPGDPVPGKLRDEPEAWSSPGDGGWQAAQAASAPAHGGTTAAGLPRRTPKANLVPGSVAPLARAQSHPEPGAAPAPVSAERLRDRISSFQQGVHRARNELSNGDR